MMDQQDRVLIDRQMMLDVLRTHGARMEYERALALMVYGARFGDWTPQRGDLAVTAAALVGSLRRDHQRAPLAL